MKRKVLIIILGVTLLFLLGIGGFYLLNRTSQKNQDNDEVAVSNIPQIVLNENNVPRFIERSIISNKVKSEEDVFVALNEIKDMYGFTDAAKEFKVLNTEESLNATYYRLQQVNSNIPVYGRQLVVAVNSNNKVTSISGNYDPTILLGSRYTIEENEAKESLKTIIKTDFELMNTEKYIYIKDDEAVVAYVFTIAEPTGYYELVISGVDGSVIDKINKTNNEVYTYTGMGADKKEHTINLEKTDDILGASLYKFHDPKRNITIVDAYDLSVDTGTEDNFNYVNATYFLLKANLLQLPITASMVGNKLIYIEERLENATSTMDTFAKTYDYYKKVLGRNSYDNYGGEIFVDIGVANQQGLFKDEEYVNASWRGGDLKLFLIGSSNGMPLSIATDISGHEFTHAVIEKTAGLIYNKESGALNESYADIMGSLIEGENFQMGEKVIKVRDMANPNEFKNPAIKDGKYYFPTDLETYNAEWQEAVMKSLKESGSDIKDWKDLDNGGVHTNSGVPNYAAYLMYKNNAFSSKEEMAKVWYKSLFLMTPTSDFTDCALAVIEAANDLGLDNSKIQIIIDAFLETKMLDLKLASISGKVVASDTQKPLKGTVVTATYQGNIHVNYEVTTNANGEYNFEKLPVGDYIIKFDSPKYFVLEKEQSLTKENDYVLDVELERIPEISSDKSEVVFVMDISLSMSSNDPDDNRKQIISDILGQLSDKAKVALVTFTKESEIVSDGLNNQGVDKKVLITDIFNIVNDNGRDDNSGTNGRAGIETALTLFSNDEDVRKYIVFFTDGQDSSYLSNKSYTELAKDASDRKIRIMSIGLGGSKDINETTLLQVANDTNGKYYHASSSLKLHNLSQRIYQELK